MRLMNGYPVEGSGFEDEVGEELFAPVVPYVFCRVELRRVWRQGLDHHIFRDAEAADASVERHFREGDSPFGDPCEMLGHRPGEAVKEDERHDRGDGGERALRPAED